MTIEPTFTRVIKCPCCSHSFSTVNVRISYPKTVEISTDFCITYQDEENSPYLYYVNVCDSCGYAFTKNSLPLSNEGKANIKREITDKWTPQNFGTIRSLQDAIHCYKLAIYCSIIKKEKYYILAGLLLRVSWLYRKLNNTTEEARYMNKTLEVYKESYQNADYYGSEMSELRILFLIGELSRRCKQFEDAVSFFSKVVSHTSASLEKGLIEKAREQWTLAREEVKKLQNEEKALS